MSDRPPPKRHKIRDEEKFSNDLVPKQATLQHALEQHLIPDLARLVRSYLHPWPRQFEFALKAAEWEALHPIEFARSLKEIAQDYIRCHSPPVVWVARHMPGNPDLGTVEYARIQEGDESHWKRLYLFFQSTALNWGISSEDEVLDRDIEDEIMFSQHQHTRFEIDDVIDQTESIGHIPSSDEITDDIIMQATEFVTAARFDIDSPLCSFASHIRHSVQEQRLPRA